MRELHHNGDVWTVGQKVRMDCTTTGSTDAGYEVALPPGAIGTICSIDLFAAPQNYAITIGLDVPAEMVDGIADQGIVNVFDESDLKDGDALSFRYFFKAL